MLWLLEGRVVEDAGLLLQSERRGPRRDEIDIGDPSIPGRRRALPQWKGPCLRLDSSLVVPAKPPA